MELSNKIQVVRDIKPSEFNSRYFNTQTPVVIKGLAERTYAGKKWSLGYFKENMGEILLDVFDNGNNKAAATAYTRADLKMKFSDYLNIIAKDEHTDLRIFLCNLFKYNSNLKKEYPCPDIFKGVLDNLGFMFFGGKDTTVRIHYDVDMSNVLHTHFGGRKRVVLIAPEYSEFLYRLPLNSYSLVDIDNPDYSKYPALRFVKGYEVILEHGDAIFMPAGYWHYMTYLEGSFSVSYRKMSPGVLKPLQGLMNIGIKIPLDKLFNACLGKKWLQLKSEIAQKRAREIAGKIYFEDFNEILGI